MKDTHDVHGTDGLLGTVRVGESPAPGAAGSVTIALADGGRAAVPASALSRRADGSLYLPLSSTELRAAANGNPVGAGVSRVTGGPNDRSDASPHPGHPVAERAAAPERAEILAPGQVARLPVVEERLRVDKRVVEAGTVAVHVTPREREEVVDVPLVEERVEVERVPVNRFVDAAPAVRQEGDVTVIPVLEEVLVVEKRLMLKEEVRLTRWRVTTNDRQRVVLRSEEVEVLRSPAPPRPGAGPPRQNPAPNSARPA